MNMEAQAPGGGYAADPNAPVPLNKLKPIPQPIDCPYCNRRTHTRIDGRSEKTQQMLNISMWPLPGRKHWGEKTQWFCADSTCPVKKPLARQKHGDRIEVLAPMTAL